MYRKQIKNQQWLILHRTFVQSNAACNINVPSPNTTYIWLARRLTTLVVHLTFISRMLLLPLGVTVGFWNSSNLGSSTYSRSYCSVEKPSNTKVILVATGGWTLRPFREGVMQRMFCLSSSWLQVWAQNTRTWISHRSATPSQCWGMLHFVVLHFFCGQIRFACAFDNIFIS